MRRAPEGLHALEGLHVLVTRPPRFAVGLCRAVEAQGGRATLCPALEIRAPEDPSCLADLREEFLCSVACAVFVSRHAVEWALRLAPDPQALLRLPALATGPGTAALLRQRGFLRAGSPAAGEGSEALLELEELSRDRVAGARILLFRGRGGRELLPRELRRRGARLHCLEVYERAVPRRGRRLLGRLLREDPPDLAVVTSGEALRNLHVMCGQEQVGPLLCRLPLLVPGDRVAALARELGSTGPVQVAPAAGNTGLLRGMGLFYRRFRSGQGPQENEAEVQSGQASEVKNIAAGTPAVGPEPEQELEPGAATPGAVRRQGCSRGAWWGAVAAAVILSGTVLLPLYYLDLEREEHRLQAVQTSLEQQLRIALQGVARRADETGLELEELRRRAAETEHARSESGRRLQKLQNSEQRLRTAFERLVGTRASRWRLAEVEQLLNIALRQVTLLHDPRTAALALEAADARLEEQDDPGLAELREQLAGDLLRLRSVQVPDLAGLAARLAALVRQVDALPPRAAAEPLEELSDSGAEEATEPGVGRYFSGLWEELGRQFTVQRFPKDADRWPPEQHEQVARTLLSLHLESARLAVLRRDQAALDASLAAAAATLGRHFDPRDPAARGMAREFEASARIRLRTKLPAPRAALQALQAYLAAGGPPRGED